MKRSRFSEEQIIGILKEHRAGLSAHDLCKRIGAERDPTAIGKFKPVALG
jgi:hypothetical protein